MATYKKLEVGDTVVLVSGQEVEVESINESLECIFGTDGMCVSFPFIEYIIPKNQKKVEGNKQ